MPALRIAISSTRPNACIALWNILSALRKASATNPRTAPMISPIHQDAFDSHHDHGAARLCHMLRRPRIGQIELDEFVLRVIFGADAIGHLVVTDAIDRGDHDRHTNYQQEHCKFSHDETV